jgi:hypothetical protein
MNTAARNAPAAIAMAPASSAVGPVQLVIASPGWPTGTSPDATAPTAAPIKNGTSTEESAKVAPSNRASPIVAASPRSAKAAPRKMIPTDARNSGTYSVSMIAANAGGKHVQSTTSTKISQTWFASQTGPIERFTSPRTRAPRWAPPAVRSQKPAPKSAPPSTA